MIILSSCHTQNLQTTMYVHCTTTIDQTNMDLNVVERQPETVTPKTRFAIISIYNTDRIRLLKFSNEEIRAIRKTLNASWPKGIQGSRFLHDNAHEIKLAGRPWWCSDSDSESTQARVLVQNLLADLFSKGWILSVPTSMSGSKDEGDMLIFRELPTSPPESEWLAIMFARHNIIRVIGAQANLIAGIHTVLRGHGISVDEKWQDRNLGSYEFHLRCLGEQTTQLGGVTSRVVAVMLLETLESFGWSVYASLQDKVPAVSRLETWYCIKRLNWVPGSPVFHR